MAKTKRFEPIRISGDELPKTRKSWGAVKPYTRKHSDRRKEQNRKACREKVRHV